MASASYQATSFLGGEISKFAQGRYDRPDYRTCLNVCFNGFPVEQGGWVRRPGTQFAGTTRGGTAGRVVRFDFEQVAPYTLEFTDGYLRFRSGTAWATTNDSQTVSAISTANPAVVQTAGTNGWSTGNTIVFGNYGSSTPLLQNRQFLMTVVDPTHFSLTDAITGATIDGSTLGTLLAGTVVSRIQEITTPYVGGSWGTVRVVQAETNAILLQGTLAPEILSVTTLPNSASGASAIFALNPLLFQDGPYLDAFTNGVQATPSAKVGIISLALSFPAYSASASYAKGAFVTSSNVNYESLVDQNVGNTPVSSPSQWVAVSAGAAINNGQGFLGTDVGRLVRLFSEPAVWLAGTSYSIGNVVQYNPSGIPGQQQYWYSLANTNTGNIPGNDQQATSPKWGVATNAALWSWGKITSLTNNISGTLAGIAYIGNMSSKGGLAAAFNGTISQAYNSSSVRLSNANGFDGVNYTGCTPAAEAISSAVIYPTTDQGYGPTDGSVTFYLYGKNGNPASGTDGTLLGSTTVKAVPPAAVTIASSDSVTTWSRVWVYMVASGQHNSYQGVGVSQIVFFTPPGTGTSVGVNVEILGPPLLYTTTIYVWRLGVYSNTTGWPTCGVYHQGRLWLAGAIPNRFDTSVSNGISGSTVNFAPTDQYGGVLGSSGISETFNSDGVNPILWMMPDQQGVVMGTSAGEWLASPGSTGAITATNIAGTRITRNGCANVEPRRTEHTIIFVQRYARKLIEFFAEVHSGRFNGPNIAMWSMHLTSPGIAELGYQQSIVPMIWLRTTDGQLRGITYKRGGLQSTTEPDYAGWHRHTLGSGRTVTSLCTGPSTGGALDAVTMVTYDGTTYHVEVMTDIIEEGATLSDAAYLDDAVAPTSTTTSNVTPSPYGGLTLNGLWHLNGALVAAWLSGLDCGDYTVSNGSITIPYGDGISAGTGSGLFTAAAFAANPTALIGFTFTSQGQPVRPNSPQESGARTGPALGKLRRTMQAAAQLEGTQGISFGTNFSKVDVAKLIDVNTGLRPAINTTFSGVTWIDSLTDSYSYDSMVCWQITRPYPANVISIQAFPMTMDK
jgi:hypothetical protein